MDKISLGCILSNSWSNFGTEHWPRMIPVLPCANTWAVWEARRYMVSQ
jgi:hypothetical protein